MAASATGLFFKKRFSSKFHKIYRKKLCRSLFFNKIVTLRPQAGKSPIQLFSCEILKNTFFTEDLRATAFVMDRDKTHIVVIFLLNFKVIFRILSNIYDVTFCQNSSPIKCNLLPKQMFSWNIRFETRFLLYYRRVNNF